jgi:hypothetical protein
VTIYRETANARRKYCPELLTFPVICLIRLRLTKSVAILIRDCSLMVSIEGRWMLVFPLRRLVPCSVILGAVRAVHPEQAGEPA